MDRDRQDALEVLYRLRESWSERSDAKALIVREAIESVIAEYETDEPQGESDD